MVRKIALTLLVLSVVLYVLPLFETESQPAPLLPPCPTPKPTSTPYPIGQILTTRQALLRHFEHRFGLSVWTEEIYPDGAIRVTGQSVDGRLRLYIWSRQGNPDDITELWFSFRYNDQVFSRSRERENGTNISLDTLHLAFPQWLEGGDWLRGNIDQAQSQIAVNGVPVYLQHSQEELSGDYITVLGIVER